MSDDLKEERAKFLLTQSKEELLSLVKELEKPTISISPKLFFMALDPRFKIDPEQLIEEMKEIIANK